MLFSTIFPYAFFVSVNYIFRSIFTILFVKKSLKQVAQASLGRLWQNEEMNQYYFSELVFAQVCSVSTRMSKLFTIAQVFHYPLKRSFRIYVEKWTITGGFQVGRYTKTIIQTAFGSAKETVNVLSS